MNTGMTSSLKLIGRSALASLNRHRLTAELDFHLGRAVGGGVERVLVEAHQGGVGERHLSLGGDVAGQAVGVAGLDDERLAVAGGFQADVGRVDGHAGRRRGIGRSDARR
jgi:hypothetical protein